MKANDFEKKMYGSQVVVQKRDDTSSIYNIKNESGEATLHRYKVFSGVDIIYNNVHMQEWKSDFDYEEDTISIDYCMEGRIECEFLNGSFLYLESKDLSVRTKTAPYSQSSFPLGFYKGVSIIVSVEKASKILWNVLNGVHIDTHEIYRKLRLQDGFLTIRAKNSIEHIFSELYNVPDSIRQDYFKIKVLEVLLYLSSSDLSEKISKKQYFSKRQVEAVKAIKRRITGEMNRHFTLNELSNEYEIALTNMKICFKAIYGNSIYNYIRIYRIEAAALMLKETQDNIIDIASKVGYDNPSKFSSAFRDIMGVLPNEYRKSICES